jgi:hypothetical protein
MSPQESVPTTPTSGSGSNALPKESLENALPQDKIEKASERIEDDWEHDPINPRNWSKQKKYLNMSLVRAMRLIDIKSEVYQR